MGTSIKQKAINNHKTIEFDQSEKEIMGMDESWWDEMEKNEQKFVNDYKHKTDNIALMQQYEMKKDPSPFNTFNNEMDLQQKWNQHLWNESMQKQKEFLDKKDKKT